MNRSSCFFVTDLHGRTGRYEALFRAIEAERPAAVFLGGDLLPSGLLAGSSAAPHQDFINDYLLHRLAQVRSNLGSDYPAVFLILGNDDGRSEEAAILDGAVRGFWTYAHGRKSGFGSHTVYGYCFIPPSPFLLKDWERYDVSRYVDPGCVSPEEGIHTVPVPEITLRQATIAGDLDRLAADDDLSAAIFLFHAPPYGCELDRADLDGRTYEGVPLDVHIGSIAIQRFLQSRSPKVSLHGHVHEAPRLTGVWKIRIGGTVAISAAHDGPELALVRFDPARPEEATRDLI